MITPAMLEEEEQLEAAGLERERKMLEKVTSGMKFVDLKARASDASSLGVWFVFLGVPSLVFFIHFKMGFVTHPACVCRCYL